MADLDKRTGGSPVEQSKDTDDILDSPYDDVSEVKDKSIDELKERKLDRGQELYTGFSFGGVDAGDVEIDDLAASDAVPKVSDNHGKKAFVLDNKKPSHVENSERVAIKTINKEDNKVFEPAGNDVVDEKTAVPAKKPVTQTIDRIDEPKFAQNELVNNKSYREIPRDTRVVIEADHGNMVYRESEIGHSPHLIRDTYIEESVSHHPAAIDLAVNVESAHDTPADYQLNGVYYGNDYRGMRNYITDPYQRDIYSIKKHYKSQAKANKKGLSLSKIAFGAAAVAGIVWLVKDDEKDSFWN